MYTYPLKLTFPTIALSRSISVTDAAGQKVLSVNEPFISLKDQFTIKDEVARQPLYEVNGDTPFRFLFGFASMSSEWKVQPPGGQPLFIFDNDWVPLVDLGNAPSAQKSDGTLSLGGLAKNIAFNTAQNQVPNKFVYCLKDAQEKTFGWIVPNQVSGALENIPFVSRDLRRMVLQVPFLYRLVPAEYTVRLGDPVNGRAVLTLKRERTWMTDTYTVAKVGDLNEAEEKTILPGVLLTALFVQQHLKDVYTN